ncbi:MAG TPA: ABC transporter permease subunit [Anaerolineaceae bacterium]|nr:ABC transporter permease subunit [Anaerolineaceae bacterium]
MSNDIFAIVWKEWRELIHQRSSRGGLMNWAIMVLIVGVLMPIQIGVEWATNPVMLLAWTWPSFLAVMWIVADSFAGERERHTLETLLASRLSDRSILYGKIVSTLLYGWSIEVASLIVGLITVNVMHHDGLVLYPWTWLVGVLAFSLVGILIISTIGCLTSMHADSARSAYQRMSLSIFAIIVIPSVILSMLPEEVRSSVLGRLEFHPTPAFFAAVGVGLIAIEAVLVWFTLQRFQRTKLILD